MKEYFNSRNVKSEILLKTITFLFVSISAIVLSSYFSGKKFAVENASNLARQFNLSSVTQTEIYLDSAKKVAENSAALFTTQGVSLEDNNHLIKYMLKILSTTKSIISVTVTLENGTFVSIDDIKEEIRKDEVLASKVPENAHYRIHLINSHSLDPQVNQNSDEIIFCDKDFNIHLRQNNTDPLSENTSFEWRKKTVEDNKSTWSKIHLSSAHNIPVITSSAPVVDSQEKIRGFFSVDISLKEISTFLNQMRISDNSRVFIVDNNQKIVGDSDMSDTVIVQNNQVTILSSADLKTSSLKKVLDQFESNLKDNDPENDGIINFESDDIKYVASLAKFPKILNLPWRAVSITPISDFSEGVLSIQKNNLYIGLLVLLIASIVIYFQAQYLSDPIIELALEADRIKSLDLKDDMFIKSHINEIQDLSTSMHDMKTNLNNFSKYIPKALISSFSKSGREVVLGGETHELTILFSDVKSFTTIAEGLEPSALMLHLSDYFEELTEIILTNQGLVDKFIGDAIMAFWGAPNEDSNQAYNGCRGALLCQQKLKTLNRYWQSIGKPPLITRIGINSGNAVVGNVGSSERMSYTALGDNVNLAARLEGVNKMYGTSILISESVYNQLSPNFITRPVDVVAVKGKQKGVKIFELVGLTGDTNLLPIGEEQQAFYKLFGQAFDLYLMKDWKGAKEVFMELQKENDAKYQISNPLTDMYIERCSTFSKKSPPEDWDGVIHLDHK